MRPVPLARLLLLPLLLLFLASAWSADPVWTGVERVVAVGDVHGDYAQFVNCLRAAKVIDNNNDWIAGKTHLVQTGDVNDRGPDTRKCFDLLMKLEVQSRKAGGMVHPLLGNHELMLLHGDIPSEASPEDVRSFGGPDAFRAAFARNGLYGKWIRAHDTVIRINDVLYVHAGLLPEYATRSLKQINDSIRANLAADTNGIANEPDGPVRTNTLDYGNEAAVARALDSVFKTYGAAHMVVGHAIDQTGVVTRASGRLIRIDVGMSAVNGGPAACLVIDKGQYFEARFPDTLTLLNLETATSPRERSDGSPRHRSAQPQSSR